MPNANVINFETVIRAQMPKGNLYIPKEYLREQSGTVNLITNGTFDTDLSGWTDDSVSTFSVNANVVWSGGKALFSTTAA
jgi:hypothetical protein